MGAVYPPSATEKTKTKKKKVILARKYITSSVKHSQERWEGDVIDLRAPQSVDLDVVIVGQLNAATDED
jgi:aryl-alcohol dehydrogenase-like predicted oxidoreductase